MPFYSFQNFKQVFVTLKKKASATQCNTEISTSHGPRDPRSCILGETLKPPRAGQRPQIPYCTEATSRATLGSLSFEQAVSY